MNTESREHYLKLLRELYPQLNHYQIHHINHDVADMLDGLMRELIETTKQIALTAYLASKALDLFLAKNPYDFSKALLGATLDIVEILNSNHRYRFLTQTIALKWRSALELALIGI
ncbi:MAG: hypothetical protein Q4B71_00355 [Cardiobacteriaceae bacterium]|nr:hypothetical protein [Cardiobacteriaceae bacterium]